MRGQPEPGASGSQIYSVSRCFACHGEDRKGTPRGPSLHGLPRNWSPPNLAAYLASPSTWIEQDARLQQLDQKFNASMPAFDNLSEAERNRLAAWLLQEDPASSSE